MKIAKEFHWEMGHRLPAHKGLCRNIHGHSYKMVVEVEGEVMKDGMIIDFYDLGLVVKPVLDKFDHSFMVWKKDKPLAEYLKKHKMKHVSVDYYATVENISRDFLNRIAAGLKKQKIKNIIAMTVKISETPNSYAEARLEM